MQNQPQHGQADQPQPNQGQSEPRPDRQDQRSVQADRRQESAPEQPQGRGGQAQQLDGAGLSEEEASALIDTAKSEELRVEDFIRQAQGGAVAEPLVDW